MAITNTASASYSYDSQILTATSTEVTTATGTLTIQKKLNGSSTTVLEYYKGQTVSPFDITYEISWTGTDAPTFTGINFTDLSLVDSICTFTTPPTISGAGITGGSATLASGVITVSGITNVVADSSFTVTLAVESVDTTAPTTSTQLSANTTNISLSGSTTPAPTVAAEPYSAGLTVAAIISITKTTTATTIYPGMDIVYTITLINATATDITIATGDLTDTLNSTLDFVPSDASTTDHPDVSSPELSVGTGNVVSNSVTALTVRANDNLVLKLVATYNPS